MYYRILTQLWVTGQWGAKLRFEFEVRFDGQDYITVCLAQEGGASYGFNRSDILGTMYSGMQDSAMVQLLRSLYGKYLTILLMGICTVGVGLVTDLVVEEEKYYVSYPEQRKYLHG